jgi:hypothetical protein
MSAGSRGGVATHWWLFIRTLSCRGGRLDVHARCVDIIGLILYHPLVPSDGRIPVPEQVVERQDLQMCSL